MLGEWVWGHGLGGGEGGRGGHRAVAAPWPANDFNTESSRLMSRRFVLRWLKPAAKLWCARI